MKPATENPTSADYVAVLSEVIELPSFLWTETLASKNDEVIRVCRLPTGSRSPLKIKAICLPYVFVKSPTGDYQTIDIRLARLVRLDRAYAKTVWKRMRTKRPKSIFGF
jgi:hypothetical protein